MERGLGFKYKKPGRMTDEGRVYVEVKISNILEIQEYGLSSRDHGRYGNRPE